MERSVEVEVTCTRTDCDGWQGIATYSQQGEFAGEWPLPVQEGCVALVAWLASDGADVQPCPLADEGGE